MGKTNSKFTQILRVVFLCAGSAGAAYSLPDGNIWILAWISLLPLIDLITERKTDRIFLTAGLFGFVFFAISFSWVTHSMVIYGNTSWFVAGLALLMMSLFFALFPAIAIWIAEKVRSSSRSYIPPSIIWPITWVAMEYVRAHLPFGFSFPWNSLGQSQHNVLPILQNADWGSFYGISFLLVFVNAVLHSVLRKTSLWKYQLVAGVILVVIALGYGKARLNSELPGKEFKVGIVQGNVDLIEKWKPENRHKILENLINLSNKLKTYKPDLLLWSESALPFMYRYAWRYEDEINGSPGLNLAKFLDDINTPLLTGTLDRVGDDIYNAAALILPNGQTDYYYKQKLVPFGEYIPLRKLFFFVDRLVDDSIGTFSQGHTLNPLKIPNGPDIAVTICYENIFPSLVRERINNGGEVICNITNDAWFGRTSAAFQHNSASRFRAVETRRPVVRCANSGVSSVVDSFGRTLYMSTLFEQDAIVLNIHPSLRRTVYLKFGDWFARGCVLLTFLLYFGTFIGKLRWKKQGGN